MNSIKSIEPEYLTVADVKKYLNISQAAACQLSHRKDFPVCRIGSSIRIPRQAFLAWVERHKWAEYWYQDDQSQVQPSTYAGYKYTLKLLTDYFQDKPLSDFKQVHINRFIDHLMNEGASRSKISKCKAMLTQIFDAAEENDLILKNPARRAKVIRDMDQTENKKDAFSEDEITRLMEDLPDDLLGNSIRTLLGSGISLSPRLTAPM